MAKDPAQREIISAEKTIKRIFGEAVDPVVLTGLAAEKMGAHHGRGRERNQKRDTDGHAENNSELAEKPTNDPAHEQNGNEDSDERSAHGENGEPNFAGAFHAGFERL